jgi:hypothetical protein
MRRATPAFLALPPAAQWARSLGAAGLVRRVRARASGRGARGGYAWSILECVRPLKGLVGINFSTV